MTSNSTLATKLACGFLESENIPVETTVMQKTVEKWERRLEPINFVELAAIALENPPTPVLTRQEIRKIRSFYFPNLLPF